MKKHIHLFGASGSGTTTIAEGVCKQLNYRHFDSDNYYWLPTAEPFTEERDREECMQLIHNDLQSNDKWILSGSITGWGDQLIPMFDLVVFVYVSPEIRIDRLKKREYERYGNRILCGGDRYEKSSEFVEWAAAYDSGPKKGRSLSKHEAWLMDVRCSVKRVANDDLEESIQSVLLAISDQS